MYSPFFALAAQSPTRQRTFRRTLAAHLARLAAAEIVTVRDRPELAPYRLDRFVAGSPAAGDHHAHVHR